MNDENMNFNQSNMQQPKKRIGLGFLISPLVLDYLVSIIVYFIAAMILFVGVLNTYLADNPEVSAYISSETDTDAIYDYLYSEVVDELTDAMYIVLDEYVVLITIIGSLAVVPVMLWLMRRDRRKHNMDYIMDRQKEALWKYVFIVIGSIGLCVALNNLITLSQLAAYSLYYAEASETLYSSSYIIQLFAYGLLTPIAEELLFRGVIYNRFRVFQKPVRAMVWSAIVFGIYHGNIVQMIYAFICGIVLVWLYERYGSLKAPILAHMCLNLTSIILSQYDIFKWLFESQIRVMVVTGACAALTATAYVVIDNQTKKYTNSDSMSEESN